MDAVIEEMVMKNKTSWLLLLDSLKKKQNYRKKMRVQSFIP